MSEAARMPIARTAEREREEIQSPDAVTFPELVWAHHLREGELRNEDGDPYAGPAEERYRAFRDQFEHHHGRIVDEYWCSDEASAVVVTVKPAALPLRWLGKDPSARIYAATNWKTRDLPVPVAELVHDCETLAMRAREVLRGTCQRLVIQRLFAVTAYLLGTFDGSDLSEKSCEPVLDAAAGEVAEIRKEYVTAATRSAQIVYFWGMVSGFAWLGVFGLLSLWLFHGGLQLGKEPLELFYGCATAGALGAMVSVVARMNASSFKVEYDVGRPTLRRLGAFRPFVGSVFGVVIYFVLASGLMYGDQQPNNRSFAFYAVFAFIAGFSERFVRDTLDGVQGGAATPPAAEPQSNEETPPAPASE
jgi:hypothetical protein